MAPDAPFGTDQWDGKLYHRCMESLAVAVMIAVLGTFACAIVSAFAALRPPAAPFVRAAVAPFAVAALALGGRLALLPIGVGMRAAGFVAAATGAAALYRLASAPTRTR